MNFAEAEQAFDETLWWNDIVLQLQKLLEENQTEIDALRAQIRRLEDGLGK